MRTAKTDTYQTSKKSVNSSSVRTKDEASSFMGNIPRLKPQHKRQRTCLVALAALSRRGTGVPSHAEVAPLSLDENPMAWRSPYLQVHDVFSPGSVQARCHIA